MKTIASLTVPALPRTARTVAALSLLLLAWTLSVLLVSSDPVQGVRMVIRLTARTSLVFFLVAFTASALLQLWRGPRTEWLLLHRRAFGLSFAVSHAVHLAAIVAFANLDAPGFAQQSSVGNMITGGLAYVFIALMAATSWDGAVRWLGARRWQLLHTVGVYYIWVSFMVSFGKRIPVSAGYLLPVLALVAALLLRLSANYRKKAIARHASLR
jgi:sulfoxide reductase heme-binding subunit YedZ